MFKRSMILPHYLDAARAGQYIDPFIRVTRIDKNPLVLLEPGIHFLPFESDMVFKLRAVARRISEGEDGVVRGLVADLHVPKDAFALEIRMDRMVAWLQTVHPHVFLGEIVQRQMVGFTEQHHLSTTSNDLAVEVYTHPARAPFKLGAVIGHKSVLAHKVLPRCTVFISI